MVHTLVYISAAATGLTRDDLRALAQQSREHNATTNITGVLLYRNGTFL